MRTTFFSLAAFTVLLLLFNFTSGPVSQIAAQDEPAPHKGQPDYLPDSSDIEEALRILSNDKKMLGRPAALVKNQDLERIYYNYQLNRTPAKAQELLIAIGKAARENQARFKLHLNALEANNIDFADSVAIYYTTEEWRKKNREPRMLTDVLPADKQMYLGWYYIWGEKNGKIYGNKDEVRFLSKAEDIMFRPADTQTGSK